MLRPSSALLRVGAATGESLREARGVSTEQETLQRERYGHFVAGVLAWTTRAVGPDLERELLLFHHSKAKSHEEQGFARQPEDLIQAERARIHEQGFHERLADAAPLLVVPHGESRDLREPGAVDFEAARADQTPVGCLGHDVLLDVPAQVIVRARQEISAGDEGSHQHLHRCHISERGGAKLRRGSYGQAGQASTSSRIVAPRSSSSRVIARRDRRRNPVIHEYRAHRQPAGERLGERVDVGDDPCLLRGKQRPRAPETTLHFVKDQRAAAGVAVFAQEHQKLGGDGAHAPFALHGFDDDGRRALGRDGALRGLDVTERNDVHVREQRLEGPAVVGPIRCGERGEQPAMEGTGERDDVGLLRPFAGELERALVRLGARITEERLTRERFRQLGGEPVAGLGAIEIGDVNQSRVERAHDGVPKHGAVVAQGIDRNARDEVEIARAFLGDELRAFARDEERANARVDAEECRGVRRGQRQCHAGWTAETDGGRTASSRVPAVACSNISRSPIRTARTPARKACAAARNLAAMPPRATPPSIIVSISPAARVGWATPSTVTPGTSETNKSSCASSAAAIAAAAWSALTLSGRTGAMRDGATGATTGVSPASSRLCRRDARTFTIWPTSPSVVPF